jgi:hypothetical protein
VTLIAVRTLDHQARFAGVASCSRIDDSTAEVAFAIADHVHGKGIATSLLELERGFRASGGLPADIDARVPTGARASKEPAIHQRIEERVTRARIQTPQSLSL